MTSRQDEDDRPNNAAAVLAEVRGLAKAFEDFRDERRRGDERREIRLDKHDTKLEVHERRFEKNERWPWFLTTVVVSGSMLGGTIASLVTIWWHLAHMTK